MSVKRCTRCSSNTATSKHSIRLIKCGILLEISDNVYTIIFKDNYLFYLGTKGDGKLPGLGLLIAITWNGNNSKWKRVINCFLLDNVLHKIFTRNEFINIKEQLEHISNGSDIKRSNNPTQSSQECTREEKVEIESVEEWSSRLNCYLYVLLETFSLIDDFELSQCLQYSIGEFKNNEIYNGYLFKNNRMIEANSLKKNDKLSRGCLIMNNTVYNGHLSGEIPHSMGIVKSGVVGFYGIMNNGSQNFGSYCNPKGGEITTTWRQQKVGRFAAELSAEGVYYYGYMANGKKAGYGVVMLLNGNVVIGNWRDNHIQGLIISLTYRGAMYSGHSANHQFCGKGMMFYRNYSFYIGEWDGNQYHGNGTLYLPRRNEILMKKCQWDHGKIVKTHQSGKYVVHKDNRSGTPDHSAKQPTTSQQTHSMIENYRLPISPTTQSMQSIHPSHPDYQSTTSSPQIYSIVGGRIVPSYTNTINPNVSDNEVSESGEF